MRILRETLMGLATLNCPVGLGIAAVFGALGSFFLLKGRTWLARLKRCLRLRTNAAR